MLAWHIVAAPFFVVFFGMLFRTHTLRKLASTSPRNRRTGWTSLVGFSVMALTGYLIQVTATPAWITAWIWIHVAASAVFVVGYTTHMVVGWRLGRPPAMRPGTLPPGRAARPMRAATIVAAVCLACGGTAPTIAEAPWRLGGFAAARQTPAVAPIQVERTVHLMGTWATLVVQAADRSAGLQTLERMVGVIERTEASLSTWRADSVLGALNRQPAGEPFGLPPARCAVCGRGWPAGIA